MRNNTAWGIEGYNVPRKYHDARKVEKKPAPRALKTGDSLTQHLKSARTMPAPNAYDIVKPWVDDKNKKSATKYVTKKDSYIDKIIAEAKVRPTPGPGAHNLRETDEEIKKKTQSHKGAKG